MSYGRRLINILSSGELKDDPKTLKLIEFISLFLVDEEPEQDTEISIPLSRDLYVKENAQSSSGNDRAYLRYHTSGYSSFYLLELDLRESELTTKASLRLSVEDTDNQIGVHVFDKNWSDQSSYSDIGHINSPVISSSPVIDGYVVLDVTTICNDYIGQKITVAIFPTPKDKFYSEVKTLSSNTPPVLIRSSIKPEMKRNLQVLPTIKGFGTNFQIRGDVFYVTSLASTGIGTLADAMSKSNRIIMFLVGGEILLGNFNNCSSNILIAGNTAPSPVTIRGSFKNIHGSNILIDGLSIYDTSGVEQDCVTIGDNQISRFQTNIVFRHCWFSQSSDELFDIWEKQEGKFHLEYCVFGPAGNGVGKRYGALFGGDNQAKFSVSIIKSIFLHNKDRNPLIKCEYATIQQCVFYNNGDKDIYFSQREHDHPCYLNAVNNVFIKGPDKFSSWNPILLDKNGWNSGSKLFVANNHLIGYSSEISSNGVRKYISSDPINYPYDEIPSSSASDIISDVLNNSGPRNKPDGLQYILNTVTDRTKLDSSKLSYFVPTTSSFPNTEIVENKYSSFYTELEQILK